MSFSPASFSQKLNILQKAWADTDFMHGMHSELRAQTLELHESRSWTLPLLITSSFFHCFSLVLNSVHKGREEGEVWIAAALILLAPSLSLCGSYAESSLHCICPTLLKRRLSPPLPPQSWIWVHGSRSNMSVSVTEKGAWDAPLFLVHRRNGNNHFSMILCILFLNFSLCH